MPAPTSQPLFMVDMAAGGTARQFIVVGPAGGIVFINSTVIRQSMSPPTGVIVQET